MNEGEGQATAKPNFFLLKAMLFPVVVVPALVVTMLVIRGNEAEQLYYQALNDAAQGNFSAAAQKFEQAGRKGHAASACNLAMLYQTGVLECKDAAGMAQKYFHLAALNGSLTAEYELGKFAENAATPDYDEAAMHYRKAALGGHAGGLIAIGRLYEYGLGVNKSSMLAKNFYEKAAQNGSVDGYTALAKLYLQEGKDADDVQAERYLLLAAEKNHPKAFTLLGHIYEKRPASPQNEQKILAYYQRASELNDPDGMVNYGDCLQKRQRYEEAVNWWRIAAEKYEHAPALHRMGVHYYRNKVDYSAARNAFGRAARQGYAVSWVNLGIMAERGEGGKIDLKQAMHCYDMAAKLGNAEASERLRKLKSRLQ